MEESVSVASLNFLLFFDSSAIGPVSRHLRTHVWLLTMFLIIPPRWRIRLGVDSGLYAGLADWTCFLVMIRLRVKVC